MSRIPRKRAVIPKPRIGVFGCAALEEETGQARQRIRSGELVPIRKALVEFHEQRPVLVAVNAVDNEDRSVCTDGARINCLCGGASRKNRPATRGATPEVIVVDRRAEALSIVNSVALNKINRDSHRVRQLMLDPKSELLRVGNLQIRIKQRTWKLGRFNELHAAEARRSACRQRCLECGNLGGQRIQEILTCKLAGQRGKSRDLRVVLQIQSCANQRIDRVTEEV